MEASLGADFKDVVVVADSQAALKHGARAFAQGNRIEFAPGEYDPESESGRELFAHELAHVVQQRQGRVPEDEKRSKSVSGRVADDALEAEADRAAARAIRGEPANLGASPGPTAGSKARQFKKNDFASMNDVKMDARTHLLPHQISAVDRFVGAVEPVLASWEKQRGTANLVFARAGEAAEAFRVFRKGLAADPAYPFALGEAKMRLSFGKNKALIREIRIFNPTALSDFKKLLGIKDAEASHNYELQPVLGGSVGGAGYGVKIGAVAKSVRIRYTNSEIKGLSWTQSVTMKGIQLGFGIGTSGAKPGASAGVSGPGKFEMATNQPQNRYLAPDFFAGAKFVNPQASAGVGAGPVTAKKNLGSALLLTKGRDQLKWESNGKWNPLSDVEVGGEADLNPDGGDMGASAGVEAVNEFGETSLGDEFEFEAGDWEELKEVADGNSDVWVPLHYARLYYETGSAEIDANDIKTIDKVVGAILVRDKMKGYEGSIFKVEVMGCHSAKYEQFDEKLRAFDEKAREGKTTKKDLDREEKVRIKKEAENLVLAQERANVAHELLLNKLAAKRHKLIHGVEARSSIEAPTTHEGIGDDPYGNLDEDRSVTILISYRIFDPQGQVNDNQ